jgi:hypothetical protein
MPSGVVVAPAVRKALWRASAKEVKPANSNFSNWRDLTFARDLIDAGSSIPIEAVRGKFWESDSEGDCDDLGNADILAMPSRSPCSPAVPISSTPAGGGSLAYAPSFDSRSEERGKLSASTTTCPSRQKGIRSPVSPRRSHAPTTTTFWTAPVRPARPPWRNIWHGLLPPPRVSPRRTLADVLILALSAAIGGSSSERKRDPRSSTRPGRFKPVQPSHGGPPSRAAPLSVGHGKPFVGPCAIASDQKALFLVAKPCRRLFRPSLPISGAPSYAEVVMAGVGGGRRGFPRARCGGRDSHPGRQPGGRGGRGPVPPPTQPPVPNRSGGRGCRGGRHGGPGGGVPNAAIPGGGEAPAPMAPAAPIPGVPAPGRPAAPRNLRGVLSFPRSRCRKS